MIHTFNNSNDKVLADGDLSSGNNKPVWYDTQLETIQFETLDKDTQTEVLIIGGGIAGLTTAYALIKEGKKIVLIDDGYIGSGESGRTTAQITAMLGIGYADIEKTFDKKTAELVANSQMEAIQYIANTIRDLNIDCDFKRVEGYLFLDPSDTKENLEEEYEATKRAGLITQMLNHIPNITNGNNKWCIEFTEQAEFNILKYLKGLANAIVGLGGKIYTKTRADKISKSGATANGFNIATQFIIVATNTPVNDWIDIHTKQWPYRTYVIATKVQKGKYPHALWNDTGDQNSKWIAKPYHYVRLQDFDANYDLMLIGGSDHRTGQANDEQIPEQDRYLKLETWAKENFPDIGDIEYKWSGQVMNSLDGLAFLGKNPGDDNIYIITGDNGNGTTNATIGAIIINDLIHNRVNPWEKVYNPSRIILKTTLDYLHEMGNMLAQFGDWLTSEAVKSTEFLKQGEGAIVSSGMKKMAAYRDKNNILHTCTAVCPHLGGILQWNEDEKTFDCPLHGSRFTTNGIAINGPAITDLEKIIIQEDPALILKEEKVY